MPFPFHSFVSLLLSSPSVDHRLSPCAVTLRRRFMPPLAFDPTETSGTTPSIESERKSGTLLLACDRQTSTVIDILSSSSQCRLVFAAKTSQKLAGKRRMEERKLPTRTGHTMAAFEAQGCSGMARERERKRSDWNLYCSQL